MDDFKMPSVGKIVSWVLLGIIGITLLDVVMSLFGMGFRFLWLPLNKFNAKLNNTTDTINIVYDAQRCIDVDAQYNNLKASIPAIRDEQIPNAQKALDSFEAKLPKDQTSWSYAEQQEDSELQTDVTGLNQQMSQLGVQYTSLIARPDTQPCLGTLPTLIDLK